MRPMTWVLFMIALHGAARSWHWVSGERVMGSRPELLRWLRTAYLAGIPIAAIWLRVVPSPSHAGLGVPSQPVLVVAVGVLLGLGVAATICLWEAAWDIEGALSIIRSRLGIGRPEGAARASSALLVHSVRDALELELHWAFFRAAVLDTSVGTMDSSGIGTVLWLALALLGVEAWSDPRTRQALGAASTGAQKTSTTAAYAIISALGFGLTGSSLAGLIAQLVARFTLERHKDKDREDSASATRSEVEPIVVGS